MYNDQEGHLWSKVEDESKGVDKEASVLVDLIEQHVRDCAACRKNPAFSCSGQSSRHLLESKVQALEAKVEQLKSKLRRVEREAAEEDEEVTSSLLSGVSRPKLLANTEYLVASGLRLVDLGVVRQAVASAQQCGHSTLSLAEVSPADAQPSLVQEDLATQLALLCLTCGAQTIFCSSAFSTVEPTNYTVNKRVLPRLGARAYYTLSSLVRESDGPQEVVRLPQGLKWQMARRLLLRLDKREEDKVEGE